MLKCRFKLLLCYYTVFQMNDDSKASDSAFNESMWTFSTSTPGFSTSCVDASQRTILVTKCRQSSRRIAGWNEMVKPYRDKSLFWHQMWIDNGRPRSGTVVECMRRTRGTYHYTVRNAKKNEERLVSEQVAECMLSNNNRDFWREIKKIWNNNSVKSKVVDGINDDVGIASAA